MDPWRTLLTKFAAAKGVHFLGPWVFRKSEMRGHLKSPPPPPMPPAPSRPGQTALVTVYLGLHYEQGSRGLICLLPFRSCGG